MVMMELQKLLMYVPYLYTRWKFERRLVHATEMKLRDLEISGASRTAGVQFRISGF